MLASERGGPGHWGQWLVHNPGVVSEVYRERFVGMAWDNGAAVWSFEQPHWGSCVQGRTADEALATWQAHHGRARVVEDVEGDEQAFLRDFQPASDEEVERTLDILRLQRARALALLDELPKHFLDHDDPGRVMPSWAGWRTIRQVLWHICDTESRYYLPQSGLRSRDRDATLREELTASSQHVREVLATMPRAATHREDGEVWTTTKLLRRLAWHERGELDAVVELLASWEARSDSSS